MDKKLKGKKMKVKCIDEDMWKVFPQGMYFEVDKRKLIGKLDTYKIKGFEGWFSSLDFKVIEQGEKMIQLYTKNIEQEYHPINIKNIKLIGSNKVVDVKLCLWDFMEHLRHKGKLTFDEANLILERNGIDKAKKERTK